MAGEVATFTINLGGNFEDSATANASAADKLAESMEEDIAVLKAMQGALRNLKAGTMGATSEAKDLAKQITAQKAAIAGSQAALLKSGTSLRDITRAKRAAADAEKRAMKQSLDSVNANRAGFKTLASQFQTVSSISGGLVSKIGGIKGALGATGAAGAAFLAAAAFVAVAAATVGATIALAAYALKVVEARRAESIRLEGLTRIPNWFGIAAGKASDMQAAIDRVSSSVALGRDKIAEYATQLYKMGLRGRNLDSALEGASIRASVLGEEMGTSFASMAAGAVLVGQSIQGMTKRVKSQLGDLANKQMFSFSTQMAKAKENIDALFRDVKIEGFLGAMQGVTSQLSQSTASGRALKTILETLLNPLFGSSGAASLVMKRMFQGMIIGALALAIAVLKLRNWWRDTFGEMKTNVNWTNVAVYVGIAAFAVLATTLALLTVTVVGLGAAFLFLFGATVLVFVGPLLLAGAAIYGIVEAAKWLWSTMKNMPWSEIGKSILDGITGPLSRLWEAGKKLGREMLKGFKSSWEIASPSKVAKRLVSKDILGGAELGAKEGGSRVGEKLGEAMFPGSGGSSYDGASESGSVAIPGGGRGYGGAQGASTRAQNGNNGSSGGGGFAVKIEQLIMQFQLPPGDPKTQSKSVAEEFAKILEGTLLQMGAT